MGKFNGMEMMLSLCGGFGPGAKVEGLSLLKMDGREPRKANHHVTLTFDASSVH